MKRTVLASAALVVCTAAACTIGSAPATPEEPGPSQLTVSQAQRIFAGFTGADAVARAVGDERLGISIATDGRGPMAMAAARQAFAAGTLPGRHQWGKPTVWIPRITSYPQWFGVRVARDGRTALLIFIRKPGDRWRLSFSSLVDVGVKWPAIRLDDDGYATALATFDESLALAPRLVGPLHATLAEEGPGGPAAGIVAAGPYTTGYFTEIRSSRQRYKVAGLNYDSTFSPAQLPVFALRTQDGGALVFYAVTRATSLVAKSKNVFRIDAPPQALPLLERPVIRRRLDFGETQQYVAAVPPRSGGLAGGGQIRVIGFDGAITRATAQ